MLAFGSRIKGVQVNIFDSLGKKVSDTSITCNLSLIHHLFQQAAHRLQCPEMGKEVPTISVSVAERVLAPTQQQQQLQTKRGWAEPKGATVKEEVTPTDPPDITRTATVEGAWEGRGDPVRLVGTRTRSESDTSPSQGKPSPRRWQTLTSRSHSASPERGSATSG